MESCINEYENVKKWNELDDIEKITIECKTMGLFGYLADHKNQRVPWKWVNDKLKLEHVYKFYIDKYNITNPTHSICFDKDYVWCK